MDLCRCLFLGRQHQIFVGISIHRNDDPRIRGSGRSHHNVSLEASLARIERKLVRGGHQSSNTTCERNAHKPSRRKRLEQIRLPAPSALM